jgi:5-methylcytosine-specific restriction endonuclease McrA
MTREVPEWIGKTDDTPAPPRVRLRVFEAHGGVCHITGQKIMPGDKWELDHIVALVNGGENRETNLAPALSSAHKAKTAQDVAQKAKDRRVRAKHVGAAPQSKSRLPGAKNSPWKAKIGGGWERRE